MTLRMKQHWDLIVGSFGALGTLTLSQVNGLLAFATGAITLIVMVLKLRREWLNRNK